MPEKSFDSGETVLAKAREEQTKSELARIRKRTPLEVWEDYLYGYDFFISYRWDDGRDYAVALAKELRKDFSVFLDSTDYAIGDSLSRQGVRAIKKTSRLILVATLGVSDSRHIKRELRDSREANCRLIAIDFNGSFELLRAQDEELRELLSDDELRVVERSASAHEAPDPAVINSIRSSLATETKRAKRRKAIAWACLTLLCAMILTLVSGALASRLYQYKQAQHYLADVLHADVAPDDRIPHGIKVIVKDHPAAIDVAKLVKCCEKVGETVHLELIRSTLSQADSLDALDSLRYLSFYQSAGIDTLAFVNKLPLLTELRFYAAGLTDAHLKTMKADGTLQVLSLTKNEDITGAEIARILGDNPGLLTLKLYGCTSLSISAALAKAIKEHADYLQSTNRHFSIDVSKTAIRSSRDYAFVVEVLRELRTDGHDIQGLEDTVSNGEI